MGSYRKQNKISNLSTNPERKPTISLYFRDLLFMSFQIKISQKYKSFRASIFCLCYVPLKENNCKFQIKNFYNDFDDILEQTDIALCRSGAGTINDLIIHKIPAIICPLPSAKDNHQYENAKILSSIKCAIIVDKNKII